MNIEKLQKLVNYASDLEEMIVRLSGLKEDEYLDIKINLSNGYNYEQLDTIKTDDGEVTLIVALVDYYERLLLDTKDEILKVANEDEVE